MTIMSERVRLAQVLLTYPQCDRSKEDLIEWLKTLDNYECCVVSKEKHHETEGDHLHAWVKFKRSRVMRSNTFQHYFDWDSYHPNIELVKNTINDKKRVIKYVIKDNDYIADNCDVEVMCGEKKGRKYDTLRMLETDIKQLVRDGEISHRDYNSLVKAQSHWKLINAKLEDMEHEKGIWIVGPPRIGKSKSVRDYGSKHGGLYIKAQNKWWDGYQMEPNVLIDDFDTGKLWHHLKLWADCYSFPAEIKGATVNVNFKNLFITSNYTIEEIMRKEAIGDNYDLTLLEALKARFKIIDWNDYKERSDWLTCEILENVIDGNVNEPESKRALVDDVLSSVLFGSGYE